jgi:hypothetical protein
MGNLTAASTKNVPVKYSVIKPGVEGTDCVHHILLLIPLGGTRLSYQEAADHALATAPGSNALTNVAIYVDSLFLFLYIRECLRIRGDAIQVEAAEGVQP